MNVKVISVTSMTQSNRMCNRRRIMHVRNEAEKEVVNKANESLLNYETIKVGLHYPRQ